jgi:hypothetical protein
VKNFEIRQAKPIENPKILGILSHQLRDSEYAPCHSTGRLTVLERPHCHYLSPRQLPARRLPSSGAGSLGCRVGRRAGHPTQLRLFHFYPPFHPTCSRTCVFKAVSLPRIPLPQHPWRTQFAPFESLRRGLPIQYYRLSLVRQAIRKDAPQEGRRRGEDPAGQAGEQSQEWHREFDSESTWCSPVGTPC